MGKDEDATSPLMGCGECMILGVLMIMGGLSRTSVDEESGEDDEAAVLAQGIIGDIGEEILSGDICDCCSGGAKGSCLMDQEYLIPSPSDGLPASTSWSNFCWQPGFMTVRDLFSIFIENTGFNTAFLLFFLCFLGFFENWSVLVTPIEKTIKNKFILS